MDADGTVIAAVQVAGHQEDVPHVRIEPLGIEVRRAAFAVAQRAF